MRFGFVVPYADTREFTELAALGERHGWDGVFTWEAVWGVHAWVTLGAAAMVTERIRLGTLLTPASRWRPWDLASAVATVDRLSGGRTIMGVGLGAVQQGWTAFEPDEGRRARAEKLDECLAVYDGLMRGQPFTYRGKYFSAEPTDHLVPDPPAQRPRPPVWVVGARVAGRGAQPSLRRAARWDGLLPAIVEGGEQRDVRGPGELADLIDEVKGLRAAQGFGADRFDVVIEADSTGEFVQLDPPDPASWEAAGATWWVESWWTIQPGSAGLAEVRRRVQAGPPGRGLCAGVMCRSRSTVRRWYRSR
jgi:alkanesulfonate monooxygenase SsuD/methylene tetrahydromethanopterin reductase-like flavin-dependent oxidoreductase (luciferase family)